MGGIGRLLSNCTFSNIIPFGVKVFLRNSMTENQKKKNTPEQC
jgi:hypothetical protein